MEQAAKLLKSSSEEKIYDVSEKVGYVSVKHFSHVFKQFFGMPPGEYQEKHRKVERPSL
jgi:two-component system response regulator YesN